jgi:hypothetical protein
VSKEAYIQHASGERSRQVKSTFTYIRGVLLDVTKDEKGTSSIG